MHIGIVIHGSPEKVCPHEIHRKWTETMSMYDTNDVGTF